MQFVSKSKFDSAYYALVPYHWHVGIRRRYVEKRLPGLKYVRWKRMEHRSRILNAFTMKARTACAGRLCGRHCVSMLTRNLHVSQSSPSMTQPTHETGSYNSYPSAQKGKGQPICHVCMWRRCESYSLSCGCTSFVCPKISASLAHY
jgi:hypothetical protein